MLAACFDNSAKVVVPCTPSLSTLLFLDPSKKIHDIYKRTTMNIMRQTSIVQNIHISQTNNDSSQTDNEVI
jgi:hypothetical protein